MSAPYYADESVTLWHGDALTALRTLARHLTAWADRTEATS